MGVNMKTVRNLALALCSLFLLSQCATQDEVRQINSRLRAMNQKIDDVRSNKVNKMQKRQASSVNKIDQIEGEVLQLKSMLEERAHTNSLNREQGREDFSALQTTVQTIQEETGIRYEDLDKRILVLEKQVALLSGNVDRLQQLKLQEAQRAARDAERKAELARKKAAAASSRTSADYVRVTPSRKKVQRGTARLEDISSSPQQMQQASTVTSTPSVATNTSGTIERVVTPDVVSGPFEKAMEQFNTGKYKSAYTSYENVLQGNPQGTKAAETLFYMGECLFRQGEYDLAILDYQKVISNHARSPLAPKALLQQGVSFEKLTDHETAKIIYNKLINDYSSSSEAKEAKKRLGSL